MELIILIALILLNGVFAMSEMALVSSRKFKLESLKKKGSPAAKTALKLMDNPTRFLSTVQIGITLIGVLLGIFSGESITKDLKNLLLKVDVLAPYANQIAVSGSVIIITYFSIVVGELFPKRLGMTFPESIAVMLARPMDLLSKIASPFVWLLSISNDFLSKIFRIDDKNDNTISEEEIVSMVKESAQGGEILNIEQDIVERVFELGDRKASALYTPKSDMIIFDTQDSWDDIRYKIQDGKHSAYPVCENNNVDNILGIVILKDLFLASNTPDFKVSNYIKEPLYFNEAAKAYQVLNQFKKTKIHYGIVIDEYGSVKGIITLNDLIDELVGDTMHDEEKNPEIKKIDNDTWIVDAGMDIYDFLDYFNKEEEEEHINNQYNTVAGYIINNTNNLPQVDDEFEIKDLKYTILEKNGQRISKIKIEK
ncbi:putative hemolysin [Soonwooa buanensis]|uniref:Putative hemolysin n=1 Tax=Soonwooa buanensis TaxID=619805 RepID=A0A1T5EV23_9FLAO|nr:hemolysin family protein [Soonwooa buanensis]SKB87756.1 putative hemolysin [Soonwooa buanensis]